MLEPLPMNPRLPWRGAGLFATASAAMLAMTGCSPALDWRDVRPAESGITVLMPCRPSAQTRAVRLADRSVKLALHACSAGGATWAVAFADVGDPTAVGLALQELQRSAAANLGAAGSRSLAMVVPGATPHEHSTRVQISGLLPDGRMVNEVVAVFAYGTVVFQATVLGERLSEEAVHSFFGSLRVGQ